MSAHDLTTNENLTIMTYISFLIYHVHTVGHTPLCVYTCATDSGVRIKELERIVRHSGWKSIIIIDSKRDFIFGYI